jgi:hypothetical protein
MTKIVALGGHSEEYDPLITSIGNQFDRLNLPGLTYEVDTLDIQNRLPNQYTQSKPKWNQQTADERANRIRNKTVDLVIVGTPGISNQYLATLLGPVTHMVIFTKKRDSPAFSEWGELAKDNNVKPTHQVITQEDGNEPLYDGTDETTIKIVRINTSGPRLGRKRSEAVEILAEDLFAITRAND